MGKYRVYLNYIQICLCILSAFVSALYLWLPGANKESIRVFIKEVPGLTVFTNILLMLNPVLGIFGDHTKRSCYYKVKFWLDLWMMLWWFVGIGFLSSFLGHYRRINVGEIGKIDGSHGMLFTVSYYNMDESAFKVEYGLFVVYFILTLIQCVLLVLSSILFFFDFKYKCCCCCVDIEPATVLYSTDVGVSTNKFDVTSANTVNLP